MQSPFLGARYFSRWEFALNVLILIFSDECSPLYVVANNGTQNCTPRLKFRHLGFVPSTSGCCMFWAFCALFWVVIRRSSYRLIISNFTQHFQYESCHSSPLHAPPVYPLFPRCLRNVRSQLVDNNMD